MDTFDRLLLTFVLAWAPYGGPREDDVWLEFGMTPEQLCVRFAQTVHGLLPRAWSLPVADRELLERAYGYLRHRSESAQRRP